MFFATVNTIFLPYKKHFYKKHSYKKCSEEMFYFSKL